MTDPDFNPGSATYSLCDLGLGTILSEAWLPYRNNGVRNLEECYEFYESSKKVTFWVKSIWEASVPFLQLFKGLKLYQNKKLKRKRNMMIFKIMYTSTQTPCTFRKWLVLIKHSGQHEVSLKTKI